MDNRCREPYSRLPRKPSAGLVLVYRHGARRCSRARGNVMNKNIKIGIIVGSTRPGRKAETIARWVHEVASKRTDAVYEVVDIAEFRLPHLDEPMPPMMGQYTQPHTKEWAARIASLDGFVFVSPEYNHSTSGALKNAIDFLFREWNDKAAGFVGYGVSGGARAVEHLLQVVGELKVATVRAQVGLSLVADFEHWTVFKPGAHQEKAVNAMLDDLIPWTQALQPLRAQRS